MANFKQSLITQIELTDKIYAGEEVRPFKSKPGKYNVYELTSDEGIHMYMYAHESENQSFDPFGLDMIDNINVDGGSYGIMSYDSEDDDNGYNQDARIAYLNYFDEELEGNGFVTTTNEGDGSFDFYTNDDHSIFVIDDLYQITDIYLNERGLNMDELLDAFDFGHLVNFEERKLNFFDFEKDTPKTIHYVGENERFIDTYVNILSEKAIQYGVEPKQSEAELIDAFRVDETTLEL